MTQQWIDIIVRSCVLGMTVLGATPSVGVAQFYLILWRQALSVIEAVIESAEATVGVRSR
jgi:hypothetical protein